VNPASVSNGPPAAPVPSSYPGSRGVAWPACTHTTGRASAGAVPPVGGAAVGPADYGAVVADAPAVAPPPAARIPAAVSDPTASVTVPATTSARIRLRRRRSALSREAAHADQAAGLTRSERRSIGTSLGPAARGWTTPARPGVRGGCHHPGVSTFETDAVVLRGIRFGEADTVLSVLTPDHGRLSAIAKGVRRPKSRLGGRLQPGVRSRLTLHRGRGDMATVRSAEVQEPNAGLWQDGYRLLAAGSVLEGALRTLPEGQPDPGAFHLVCRGLSMLARAIARDTPPRLDPVVLGVHAKLLVVAGLVPRLGPCADCAPGAAMVAYSAVTGGAVCRACAAGADPTTPAALAALEGLLTRPLAEAAEVLPTQRTFEVERLLSLTLREHLGVELRSASSL